MLHPVKIGFAFAPLCSLFVIMKPRSLILTINEIVKVRNVVYQTT